jgi:hypothetical protein
MATKRTANKHPVVEKPSPKADAWTIHVQSKLVELESVKAASDRKWGENRLTTLVSSEVREKFWTQNGRLHQAMAAKDWAKFDSIADSMADSNPQRDVQRIRTRQWLAERWDQKTYGLQKAQQININVQDLRMAALRHVEVIDDLSTEKSA